MFSLEGRGMSATFSNSIIALTPWFRSCMSAGRGPEDFRPDPDACVADWDGVDIGGIPVSSWAFSSMPQLTGTPYSSLSRYGHTWEDRGSRRWIWHLPITLLESAPMPPAECSTWMKRSGDSVRSRMMPSFSPRASVSIEGSGEDSGCRTPRISPDVTSSRFFSSKTRTRYAFWPPKSDVSMGMSSRRVTVMTRFLPITGLGPTIQLWSAPVSGGVCGRVWKAGPLIESRGSMVANSLGGTDLMPNGEVDRWGSLCRSAGGTAPRIEDEPDGAPRGDSDAVDIWTKSRGPGAATARVDGPALLGRAVGRAGLSPPEGRQGPYAVAAQGGIQ
mmetsp:Transcript_75682/g.198454  ORF Transcript_75682/g.198454 Transcript_75682/m.198454 type:complete len:331 (+) Transcript_75682:1281-2273(+)